MISDIRGRELLARTVFACAIRYRKDHLLDELKKKCHGSLEIHRDRIKWVLTVPAFWDDKAMQFMRNAAKEVWIRKRT